MYNDGAWMSNFDTEQFGFYAYRDDDWIATQNGDSLKAKANYINNSELGGAYLFSIDEDDFSGDFCGLPFPVTFIMASFLNL